MDDILVGQLSNNCWISLDKIGFMPRPATIKNLIFLMACLLSAGCTTQVFYQNTTGQLARVTPAMIDGTPKLEVMRITRLYGYASSNHYLDSETGIPGAKFPLYLPPGIYQFEVRCVNLNPQTIVLFYEFPEVRAKVVANGEYVIDCDMNHCDIELKVDDSKY